MDSALAPPRKDTLGAKFAEIEPPISSVDSAKRFAGTKNMQKAFVVFHSALAALRKDTISAKVAEIGATQRKGGKIL